MYYKNNRSMSFPKNTVGWTSIHHPSFQPTVVNSSSSFLWISRVTLANSSIWSSTIETRKSCVLSRLVDGK